MKVEKCPLCDRQNYPVSVSSEDGWYMGCHCWMNPTYYRPQSFWSKTRTGAIVQWNRWARREAKRIAKEGKGK